MCIREGGRKREREEGGCCWNNAPLAAGAMDKVVCVGLCVCVCDRATQAEKESKEHFLFCVN